MWRKSMMNVWLTRIFSGRRITTLMVHFGVTQRSNRLVNYFLAGYFILGLLLAPLYGTWLIAVGVGGLSLTAYYLVKLLWSDSCQYQYVLSVVLGVFMAQFIYQAHGMFEMHFFAFIGSALLITYQNWKLQIPLLLFIVVHHALFSGIQDTGIVQLYFNRLSFLDLPTFATHILLTGVICFICGLCAFQLHKYHQIQLVQAEQMTRLQEAAQLAIMRQKNTEAMEERNVILESIGDAFFAVDKNWIVTYWNHKAEEVLFKTKQEMLAQNLWSVFSTSTGSESYRQYHQAVHTNRHVHFEDYFQPLDKWYDISAYPSTAGLSVYFKDITERKRANADLQESEQRYSDVFHFSPLPMWVVDLTTLRFMDVNRATVAHYGYSREEFLTMTLKDIRPPKELTSMENALAKTTADGAGITHSVMVHRKKDGGLMNVEIQVAPFQFKGTKTSIVIATDITERLQYIKAIEQQNEKLTSISWMQSHVIRAPLARIMALIPMYVDPHATLKDRREISGYLVRSAGEMDAVIKNITDATCTVAV